MVWINTRDKDIPTVMVIGGSDSGGGAGIQADIKTLASIGVYGVTIITAVTAQNTLGVDEIFPIPPKIISAQIDSVTRDFNINAIKVSVLYTKEAIELVHSKLKNWDVPRIVDPILKSQTGFNLLDNTLIVYYKEKILPITDILTPNIYEAEVLTGIKIRSRRDVEKSLKELKELGVGTVVLKGGHLSGSESIDYIYDGYKLWEIKAPKVDTKNVHGSGCVFSTAIAGYIAKGLDVKKAIKEAKKLITMAIKFSLNIGRGNGPVNPLAKLYRESEKFRVLEELWVAYRKLRTIPNIYKLVPETRINFVYSLPEPLSTQDVAGFPGRITMVNGELKAFCYPRFGASKHVANVVLTLNKVFPEIRSGINLKYDERFLEIARENGYKVLSFNRRKEPESFKIKEGSTLIWGVGEAIKNVREPPDIIYDLGDVGKEPMIRLVGMDPFSVVEKISNIMDKYLE